MSSTRHDSNAAKLGVSRVPARTTIARIHRSRQRWMGHIVRFCIRVREMNAYRAVVDSSTVYARVWLVQRPQARPIRGSRHVFPVGIAYISARFPRFYLSKINFSSGAGTNVGFPSPSGSLGAIKFHVSRLGNSRERQISNVTGHRSTATTPL
jgi:hypothetical protein